MDINRLATEIHVAALSKGFWDVPNAEECAIACMHAEISEAVQADRLGMPLIDIERDDGKPEGVGVELADFCMRLMDYCAEKQVRLSTLLVSGNDNSTLPHLACKLHRYLERMLDKPVSRRSQRIQIAEYSDCMLSTVADWISAHGGNLVELIYMKMEYNKSRPALHGRKY